MGLYDDFLSMSVTHLFCHVLKEDAFYYVSYQESYQQSIQADNLTSPDH